MEENYIFLDKPFSANNMGKTKKYKQWIKDTAPLFSKLKPAVNFPITVDIFVVGGSNFNSKNDVDNINKPFVDSLVRCGIIPDDSTTYVESVNVRFIYGYTKSKPQIKISIIEPE